MKKILILFMVLLLMNVVSAIDITDNTYYTREDLKSNNWLSNWLSTQQTSIGRERNCDSYASDRKSFSLLASQSYRVDEGVCGNEDTTVLNFYKIVDSGNTWKYLYEREPTYTFGGEGAGDYGVEWYCNCQPVTGSCIENQCVTETSYQICSGNSFTTTIQCPSGEYCHNGDCVKENCHEQWTCTSWSDCKEGQQERDCKDLNDCGTTTYRPSIEQSCENSDECPFQPGKPEQCSVWKDYPICRWSNEKCNEECTLICGDCEILNENDCICEPIFGCGNSGDIPDNGESCTIDYTYLCSDGEYIVQAECIDGKYEKTGEVCTENDNPNIGKDCKIDIGCLDADLICESEKCVVNKQGKISISGHILNILIGILLIGGVIYLAKYLNKKRRKNK